jgi:hypothetical protein
MKTGKKNLMILLIWDYPNDCWRAYEYDAATGFAVGGSYTLGKRAAGVLVADGVASYAGGQ